MGVSYWIVTFLFSTVYCDWESDRVVVRIRPNDVDPSYYVAVAAMVIVPIVVLCCITFCIVKCCCNRTSYRGGLILRPNTVRVEIPSPLPPTQGITQQPIVNQSTQHAPPPYNTQPQTFQQPQHGYNTGLDNPTYAPEKF